MPKASRRKTRRNDSKKTNSPVVENETNPKQRRENRRKRFMEKLDDTKAFVQKRKNVEKHGAALGDVDSLADALQIYAEEIKKDKKGGKKKEETESKAKRSGKMKNKARKKLAVREVALFKQVLAHPAVKEDACKAIKEHLVNTIAQGGLNQENIAK